MQKTSAAAQRVLARSELADARAHFAKAGRFFRLAPDADYPNSVKEAVAALEPTAKSLFPNEAGKDLPATLAKLRGIGDGEIPPTIVKAAEAIYAFRGAASGVSHGGADGGAVSANVAELILSISAAFITYLADLADGRADELPF
jgi:hypothetical protein